MYTRSRVRFPLLALGMISLLLALWGGVIRLGWELPMLRPALMAAHGPLMISGFLGALISLERAVALQQRWMYAVPALAGGGALLLLVIPAMTPGILLVTIASAGLVVVFVVIVRQHPALHTYTMALGALTWLVGNALWAFGRPVAHAVPWWAAFLILTIAGERLELGRLLRLSQRAQWWFVGAIGTLLVGLVVSTVAWAVGVRVLGISLLGLAVWLLRYDIARRTVRQTGLPRFIAVCLLSGYVWLVVGGLLAVWFDGVVAGPRYDAMWHAIFLGFVMAMIFGHAPIIFPAVLGLPVQYTPRAYVPLVLLHASLLMRVGGDIVLNDGWRMWGGMLNAIAVVLFLVNMASSLLARHESPAART